MQYRECKGCDRRLPLMPTYFYPDKAHSSGYQRKCRDCTRKHFDALDAPPIVPPAAPEPEEITLTRIAEVFADELALGFLRYADVHDRDLYDKVADYLAGASLPDPELDGDAFDAAVDAEWERCPAAYYLRICPGLPVGEGASLSA